MTGGGGRGSVQKGTKSVVDMRTTIGFWRWGRGMNVKGTAIGVIHHCKKDNDEGEEEETETENYRPG